ncbi:Uncharacterised protein [uncultured archaeon]|nr:Uncharacterised protein [uncultured archaeon]
MLISYQKMVKEAFPNAMLFKDIDAKNHVSEYIIFTATDKEKQENQYICNDVTWFFNREWIEPLFLGLWSASPKEAWKSAWKYISHETLQNLSA